MRRDNGLIVIEGIDSSGKGTQAELLCRWMRKHGKRCSSISFPQYDSFFGRIIGRVLRGEINPAQKEFAMLYALDRFKKAEWLREKLKEGFVVCDRYVESNMAYQEAKKEGMAEWVEKIEYSYFKMPKPSIVIVLRMPIRESQKLMRGRKTKDYLKGSVRDRNESNMQFLEAVDRAYASLAEKKGWLVVDEYADGRVLTIEEVHKRIVGILKERL